MTVPEQKRSTVPEQKRSIGVFPNRFEAEKAIDELKVAGFPMDKVSALGQSGNS